MRCDTIRSALTLCVVAIALAAPGAMAQSKRAGLPATSSPTPESWNLTRLDTARQTSYLSDIERDIVLELNKVRSDPGRYAELYLSPMRGMFQGLQYVRPGQITIITQEGIAAVDDAIAALRRARPAPPLTPSRGMSDAARDHAHEQGRNGRTGHDSSDGSTFVDRLDRYGSWERTVGENIAYGTSTARDIVVGLIVDDGVPSRGHRDNILNGEFGTVGIAVGPHTTYRTVAVMDLAGGYREAR